MTIDSKDETAETKKGAPLLGQVKLISCTWRTLSSRGQLAHMGCLALLALGVLGMRCGASSLEELNSPKTARRQDCSDLVGNRSRDTQSLSGTWIRLEDCAIAMDALVAEDGVYVQLVDVQSFPSSRFARVGNRSYLARLDPELAKQYIYRRNQELLSIVQNNPNLLEKGHDSALKLALSTVVMQGSRLPPLLIKVEGVVDSTVVASLISNEKADWELSSQVVVLDGMATLPDGSPLVPWLLILVGALTFTGSLLIIVRRWSRPTERWTTAVSLEHDLLIDVSRASQDLWWSRWPSIMIGILVLWIGWPGLFAQTPTHAGMPQMLVLLAVAAGGVILARDFTRLGPSIELALVIATALLVLNSVALASGATIDHPGSLAFSIGLQCCVVVAAWRAWQARAYEIVGISAFAITITRSTPLIRPGTFASRRYARVAFWLFLSWAWRFLRFLPALASNLPIGLARLPFVLGGKTLQRLTLRRKQASAVLASDWLSRDPRPPVLFLRSFADDDHRRVSDDWAPDVPVTSFEEMLIEQLWAWGPVIAFGNPAQHTHVPGAVRDQVSHTGWQARFDQIATQASLVVYVIGSTPSLGWELQRLHQLGMMHKAILVRPDIDDNEFSARWEGLRAYVQATQLPPLPAFDSLSQSQLLAIVFHVGRWLMFTTSRRSKEDYDVCIAISARIRRDTPQLS